MEETGLIESVKTLLEHPSVKEAGAIELSICDAIHFRLVRSESISRMIELRLRKRDPFLFAGFAETRIAVEEMLRGTTIIEKIDACCAKRPAWLEHRSILYSTELEVWMEMSYPNPFALDLYHSALAAGKDVIIPRLGPFSETFHTLLKEKNGYELTKPPSDENRTVRVLIGEQTFLDDGFLHLLPPGGYPRKHPLSGEDSIACQLAYGIMEKDLEDTAEKATDEAFLLPHHLGYRFIGPTLLLLIQSLGKIEAPAVFEGTGSEFLTALTRSLQSYWPWLPKIPSAGAAAESFSLFPGEGAATALLPDSGHTRESGILELGFDEPAELLLPAIRWVLEATFAGPHAESLQRAAAAFIRDYAQMTRGLFLPVPVQPVVRGWCQCLLSPEEDFIKWATVPGQLPGYKSTRSPWQLHRQIHNGPWPTGSYLRASGTARWLALRSDGRIQDIVEAINRFA